MSKGSYSTVFNLSMRQLFCVFVNALVHGHIMRKSCKYHAVTSFERNYSLSGPTDSLSQWSLWVTKVTYHLPVPYNCSKYFYLTPLLSCPLVEKKSEKIKEDNFENVQVIVETWMNDYVGGWPIIFTFYVESAGSEWTLKCYFSDVEVWRWAYHNDSAGVGSLFESRDHIATFRLLGVLHRFQAHPLLSFLYYLSCPRGVDKSKHLSKFYCYPKHLYDYSFIISFQLFFVYFFPHSL